MPQLGTKKFTKKIIGVVLLIKENFARPSIFKITLSAQKNHAENIAEWYNSNKIGGGGEGNDGERIFTTSFCRS